MKRILVALDASPRARSVLTAAVDLARRIDAKLVLLRSVGVPVELPVQAYSLPPGSLAELLENDARKGLEELSRTIPAELVMGTRVHVGTPWQSICDAAREEGADLIVIGSHGYSVLDRVLGTTAAKVVNHADRSVLVVRAHAEGEQRRSA
jgi:nucleotide-binding universal stress UspA family protein